MTCSCCGPLARVYIPALAPPGLGPPGPPAFLTLVRDQIVVPGNAVHRGGERIGFEPAPVQPVGQVTC